MTAAQLAQQLNARFPELFSGPAEFRGELSLVLKDPERIAEVAQFARQSLGFDYLVDITGVDMYGDDPRFLIVYHLYGYDHHQYLRLKTYVSEDVGELPTVIPVWATADWHEREIFDMLGIQFRGHPDLRRILMWDGYPYFPLRKDFPVAGKPSDAPEVAFSERAPMAGGPFVTVAGGIDAISREPRVRLPESDSLEMNARVERRQDIGAAHGKASGPGPIHAAPQTAELHFSDAAGRAAAQTATMPGPPPTPGELETEKMVLNMGPSHPATHGVLRLLLELDGEIITKVTPHVGYLHRGDEKIAENMTYTQFIPYSTGSTISRRWQITWRMLWQSRNCLESRKSCRPVASSSA
jgi:NADH-quinone oxidoreductase subunit C